MHRQLRPTVTRCLRTARCHSTSGSWRSDLETADGDLTYEIVTQPEHGELSGSGPSFTYNPDAGYSGPDAFTYRVWTVAIPTTVPGDPPACADPLTSNTATVTITVEAEPNTPPSAEANGPYTADEGADVVIDGTAADADEDTLTYAWSAEPGLDVDACASCAFADAAALDTSVACTDDGPGP